MLAGLNLDHQLAKEENNRGQGNTLGDAKNTIEINGKLYNARTGELLGNQPHKINKATPGAIMDGVVRKPSASAAHSPKKAHAVAERSSSHHKQAHPTKTLARKGLKKPDLKTKPSETTPKLHHESTINQRLKRAHNIAQSNKISRFARGDGIFTKKAAPLPVAQPSHNLTTSIKHVADETENRAENLEKAVQDATSHLTKFAGKEKKKFLKSKKLNAVAGSLAVILLVGFLGYQNAPNIRMRIASTDAGFSAHLPGYKPAGFGLNNSIQSEPGKVTVTFKSRTDDRSFNITQSASNWSSESLGNELASKDNKQTWQEQGKTVYTYGESNAAWVDGGVLYQIEGDSSLNSDQLRRIVNSF